MNEQSTHLPWMRSSTSRARAKLSPICIRPFICFCLRKRWWKTFLAKMPMPLKFVSHYTGQNRLNLHSKLVNSSQNTVFPNYIWFFHCFPCPTVPLCSEFLKRKWYAFDGKEMQGAECNMLLEHLLRGFFRDIKFSSIKVNLQWMKKELLDIKAKGGCLKTFPCIKL